MNGCVIRDARRADAALIRELIIELAEYEKLAHEMVATETMLAEQMFGREPAAHALIAEVDGMPAGFALYFFNFSTFLGRPGLYLEDLFVRPAFRSGGIGRRLLVALAQRAAARDCGRMEWAVLDWNVNAQRFYESLGARAVGGWQIYRMQQPAIESLARSEDR